MLSSVVSRLVILVFGTLYPAYASYKAIRSKNLKEYVKWMMYWIVFAFFTCAETFTDVFLSFWFPFYYEVKIILVLWLLSPATKGSSYLYRRFVHPMLARKEQDIDDYITKAREQGYHTVLELGSKGMNYATNVILQTAIKNLPLPVESMFPPKRSSMQLGAPNHTSNSTDNFPETEDEVDYGDPPRKLLLSQLSDEEEDLIQQKLIKTPTQRKTRSRRVKKSKTESGK